MAREYAEGSTSEWRVNIMTASSLSESQKENRPRFGIEGYLSHLEGTLYRYSSVIADLNSHREKDTLVADTAYNREAKRLLGFFSLILLIIAACCLCSVFYPIFRDGTTLRVGTIQSLEPYVLITGLTLTFVFTVPAALLLFLLFVKTARYEKALESKITKAVEELDLEANLESWLNLHHGLSCENLSTVARKLILLPSEVEVQLMSLESNELVTGKLKVETPLRIFLVSASSK